MLFAVLAATTVGMGAGVQAGMGDVTINGFGHQSYLKTDTNQYITSNSSDGSFDDFVLGLTFTAKVNDKIRVRSQIVNDLGGIRLDWGFGEYNFNDNFGFKVGKVKLPAGLQTETQDVKALQPFAFLPQPLYGSGVNSYTGAGLFAGTELENGFSGEVEVFVGKSTADQYTFAAPIEFTDFIGGRLMVTTPVPGLRFGGAFVSTKFTLALPEVTGIDMTTDPPSPIVAYIDREMDVRIPLGFVEYVGDRLFVRGEYAQFDLDYHKSPTYYVEAGYLITPVFQPVARYTHGEVNDITNDLLAMSNAARGITDDMTEIAFGLNVFLGSGMVVKAEYHAFDGSAELDQQTFDRNAVVDDKWNMMAAQVAFMF